MLQLPEGELDFLAIGEALVDFIALEQTDTLPEVERFSRHQGGSPANIAANLARLGGRTALVARVGADVFGEFITATLAAGGVRTDYLIADPDAHTSLVFVSQTSGTPDFAPFRDADFRLERADIPVEAIRRTRILHLSTWPLSREPARSAAERALWLAKQHERVVCIDPNYSPKLWPNPQEALQVMRRFLCCADIVKPSLDDAQRLFGGNAAPEVYVERFHDLGPELVVLTMGARGTLLSSRGEVIRVPARKIKVVDATGAGDAFWAGFLAALLDGQPAERCLLFAREVAELKLTHVGPLPAHVNREAIYEAIGGR